MIKSAHIGMTMLVDIDDMKSRIETEKRLLKKAIDTYEISVKNYSGSRLEKSLQKTLKKIIKVQKNYIESLEEIISLVK